jgi:hypothetical protein
MMAITMAIIVPIVPSPVVPVVMAVVIVPVMPIVVTTVVVATVVVVVSPVVPAVVIAAPRMMLRVRCRACPHNQCQNEG